MATQSRFKINGFADTRNSVFTNLEDMATASSTWVNFDNSSGKWSVILNGPTPPGFEPRVFDESNILGEIKLVQKDINTAYTAGKITYPNIDQAGKTDEVSFQLEERYFDTNFYFGDEPPNVLSMSNPFINNVVQGQLILSTELRQSRLDQAVEFETDYSNIGMRAGEVIVIRNLELGWGSPIVTSQVGKPFRVVSIEEIDSDDGAIVLAVTAVEHDNKIYNYAGFTRPEVFRAEPLPPLNTNTGVQQNINESTGQRVGEALQTDAGRAAISGAGIPLFETLSLGFSVNETLSVFGPGNVGNTNTLNANFSINTGIKNLQFFFEAPQGVVNYVVDGVNKTIVAGVPCQVDIIVNGQLAAQRYLEWSTYTTVISLANLPAGSTFELIVRTLNTFDLNATDNNVNITSVSDVFADPVGDATKFTIALFLN
jgi:hypothetical protein